MAKYKISSVFEEWGSGNKLTMSIPINTDAYNSVSGTFVGSVNIKMMTKNSPGTIYWNYKHVSTTVIQGSNRTAYIDEAYGQYRPGGYEYNVSSSIEGVKFINTGTRPKIEYNDAQDMFLQLLNLAFPMNDVMYFDGTITPEKPSDFSCYTKNIYEDIIVNFVLKSTNKVKYRITQNGKLVRDWTLTTGRSITISKGTLQSTDNLLIEAYSLYNFSREYPEIQGETVSFTVSGLKALTAEEPQNFRVVGTERRIEEDILFAWDTTDIYTNKTTLELWQDGYKLQTSTGITNKQYILRGGALKSTNSIELRLYNVASVNGYTATSRVVTLRVSDLKTIAPILKDFTLDGLNLDYDITATPDCTGATAYSINGRSGLVVPRGTLTAGNQEITLLAGATSSVGVTATARLTKTFTITKDLPLIYSLEPSNLDINITGDTLVSFATNAFIGKWALEVGGKIVTGTTDRKYMATRGTFAKGLNKIKLTAEYNPPYNVNDKRHDIKEVTFYGYGYPTLPTFTGGTVCNVPRPTITWQNADTTDSDMQTAYQLTIKKDGVIIEDVVKDSLTASHTVTAELLNNTDYEVTLKIKNRFNLWGDAVTRIYRTNFNNLPIIDFDLYDNNGNVLVKVDIEGNIPALFEQIKVYKKTPYDVDFIMIADKVFATDSIVDYTAPSGAECLYKVRLYDTSGAYSESSTKAITVTTDHYTLNSVTAWGERVQLPFASSVLKFNNNNVAHLFANATAPEIYEGSVNYATVSMKVTLEIDKIAELKNLLRERVLLYKDYRSNKHYVNAKITSIDKLNYIFNTVTIEMAEIRYSEERAFSPAELKAVALLNDTALLDGTRVLRGYK